MKSFVIALFMLAVVVASLLVSYSFVAVTSNENAVLLQDIYTEIERENWQSAEELFAHAHQKFDREHAIYKILIDHNELDAIAVHFLSLEQFLKSKEMPNALVESANAKFLLEHLKSKNKISIANIL